MSMYIIHRAWVSVHLQRDYHTTLPQAARKKPSWASHSAGGRAVMSLEGTTPAPASGVFGSVLLQARRKPQSRTLCGATVYVIINPIKTI